MAEHGSRLADKDRGDIENAMADLRQALKADDADAIAVKAGVLQQQSVKLAEAAQAAPQAPPGSAADAGRPQGEGIVDAEFTEIDDDKKRS